MNVYQVLFIGPSFMEIVIVFGDLRIGGFKGFRGNDLCSIGINCLTIGATCNGIGIEPGSVSGNGLGKCICINKTING